MSIRKRLGKYLRDKLGVTALRGLVDKIDYLTTYINLVGDDKIIMPDDFYLQVLKDMSGGIDISSLNKTIHKNDLMFQFHLARNPRNSFKAFYSYFDIGLRTTRTIEGILKKESIQNVSNILDFGSGYGRISRFYPLCFPGANISVSDVKNTAMEFQRNEFEYETIVHSDTPLAFPDLRYDLIIALSVFSHLPVEFFKDWFEKLYSNLNPGGIIILSFNDISICPFENNGNYYFEHSSEDSYFFNVTDSLRNTSNYGSTFISRERLETIVQEITNRYSFIEKAFNEQDAVILLK